MQIITDARKAKIEKIARIKADYHRLIEIPGSMKTAVYKELAQRYNVTQRSILTYVKK